MLDEQKIRMKAVEEAVKMAEIYSENGHSLGPLDVIRWAEFFNLYTLTGNYAAVKSRANKRKKEIENG